MTQSQKADQLQIRPFDEKDVVPTAPAALPDPRVTAFLERLRAKAEAIEATQRENHVTVKEPRRRAIVEQAANPDWYQSRPAEKKAATTGSFVKRFMGKPKPKAKTG